MEDHSLIFGLLTMVLVGFSVWVLLSVFTSYTPKEVANAMVWFVTPFVSVAAVGIIVIPLFLKCVGAYSHAVPFTAPAPELSAIDKWGYAHPLAYMIVLTDVWYTTFACLAWCATFGISERPPTKRHWWFVVGFLVFIGVMDTLSCIHYNHGPFNQVTNSYEWR